MYPKALGRWGAWGRKKINTPESTSYITLQISKGFIYLRGYHEIETPPFKQEKPEERKANRTEVLDLRGTKAFRRRTW